jgi:hypothetical protein
MDERSDAGHQLLFPALPRSPSPASTSDFFGLGQGHVPRIRVRGQNALLSFRIMLARRMAGARSGGTRPVVGRACAVPRVCG